MQPSTVPALSSLLSLAGKSAIVTGGAKGIGKACAARLAEAGCRVVVVDNDAEAVAATVKEIEAGGHKALGVTTDVSKPEAAHKAVDACAGVFGGVDILVNNAGVFPMVPLFEVSEALWDRVLDVNLKGSFFFAQAAARRMVDAGAGTIVQIASIDALHPTGNLTAYDASKGGMLMLTKSLAKELAPKGVRVNTICPGGVATPGVETAMQAMARAMNKTPAEFLSGMGQGVPLGRMGEPDDIARAVLYFASPLSSWVTGATLVVDGGALLA